MDRIIENVGRRSDDWTEAGAPTDLGENSLNGFEKNALFWNRGEGSFVDVGYLTHSNLVEDGRGVAVADFDRDGRLDLVVTSLEKPVALLMGRGGAGHWLQLELEGTHSNRDAIGAVVTLRAGGSTQVRQVAAGSGFLSSSSPVLHFGLGESASVDSVVVRWPSGRSQELASIDADQRLSIREGGPSEATAAR